MNTDLQINFVYLKIHSQKIVDFFENGKPISIINNAAYTKTINETKIINTLPHDSQSILSYCLDASRLNDILLIRRAKQA